MRTSTWIASISILLNIVMAVLLTEKLNPKAEPATLTPTTKETIVNTTIKDEVKSAVQNDIPVKAMSNIDYGSVVAIINETEVRQLELLPYINEVIPANKINQYETFNTIPVEYLKSAIDSYAVDLLFMKLADKKGVSNNSRLQSIINKNQRRNIRTAYLSSIASTLVSEEQVKNKYDELMNSLKNKKEFRTRHILLASEEEANIINKALIKKERDFDELAKLFSLDDATGFKGGDLGYRVTGQLNPEFEQAISKLKLNNYSQPFKTELGWHIAVVEDKRDALIMPYEQAAPGIHNNLQQQAIKKLAQRLVKNANIKLIKP
ncbi:MAG: hypothetical protein COA54_11010 [Thiotrichaceae bacterium]|nr:MAG: hypothetical protein COA54_11010 [Thiotrichaceae bacterium]